MVEGCWLLRSWRYHLGWEAISNFDLLPLEKSFLEGLRFSSFLGKAV